MKAHETTQGGLDDFREFAEFLATRTEENLKAHVTAEVGAVRAEISGDVRSVRSVLTAIERRFDRLEERLFRKRRQ